MNSQTLFVMSPIAAELQGCNRNIRSNVIHPMLLLCVAHWRSAADIIGQPVGLRNIRRGWKVAMDDLNSAQSHADRIKLTMRTPDRFRSLNDAPRVELRISLEATDARETRIIC